MSGAFVGRGGCAASGTINRTAPSSAVNEARNTAESYARRSDCAPLQIDSPSCGAARVPQRRRVAGAFRCPESAVGNRLGRLHTSWFHFADEHALALCEVTDRDARAVGVHDLALAG